MQDEAPSVLRWTAILGPWCVIVGAWVVLLFAFSTQQAAFLDHDYLLRVSHLPWLLVLLLFLLSWQVMIAAMMLPSLLSPLVALQRLPGMLWLHQARFIAGYAAVWTLFALGAFIGDTFVHWLVSSWWTLYTHPWLISTTLLLLAGVVQFSPQKCASLERCRRDALCLHAATPWRGGLRYGWSCLGSCWAMMLVMFGLGMRSLPLLCLLTAGVLLEKTGVVGKRLRPLIGIAFLLAALGITAQAFFL